MGLVLTSDELAALGVKGIERFADGDASYGYCFRKHSQRGRTLWTIERMIASKPGNAGTVTALTPARPVGFGAIEASYKAISSHIELPVIR